MRSLFAFAFLIFLSMVAHAEILIGVAGPMSGTSSAFGTQMVQGVQAAVDQLNATGGIEGELIEIVTADDACDNRKAELAAQSLIAKNVAVVIGHFCSYPSLAAAKIYDAAGIPMIAPSASLPELTETGLANVVRLASRDDAQGQFAAMRMKVDFPLEKIAVLDDGSAAALALITRFNASGGAPAFAFEYKPGTKLTDAMIAELTAKSTAAIYCACAASDAGVFAAQFAEADLTIKIFAADAVLAPAFWEKSGSAGEGTFVSFAVDPQSSPAAQKVVKQLALENVAAEGAVLPAFAAVQIFAAAAEKMGSKNSRGMIDFVRSGASIPTAIGTLAFDAKGDLREPRFVWYVWSKGKFATEYLDK